MLRIAGLIVIGVVYGAWKLFEANTYARNAWGDWLFKGKKPWPYTEEDNKKK